MDPQVSNSFIPKAALTEQKARASGVGLVTLISLFIFALSVVAAGASFAYSGLVQGQLAKNQASLAADQAAFDPATINDLMRLDSRMRNAVTLLSSHVAPSGLFGLLSADTLPNVQFTSFDYALNQDGSATLHLDGTADSFSTVAQQSDAFGSSKVLKDIIFSGIAITGSGVSFTVQAGIDPSIISYSKQLQAAAQAPQ